MLTRILFGGFAGVLVGLIAGPENYELLKSWVGIFGQIFLNLLKLLMMPLIFTSMTYGVCSLGDIRKLGRLGVKTFSLYTATTIVAMIVSIVTAELFIFLFGMNIQKVDNVSVQEVVSVSFADFIVGIFPANALQAMVNDNLIGVIFISIMLGVAILLAGEKAELVKVFFHQISELCYRIIGWVVWLAPLGVFGLLAPIIAKSGMSMLLSLGIIVLAVYFACFLHWGTVYSGLLVFNKINPYRFFRAVFPASFFAFSTSSSNATLPVTMRCCSNMGISKSLVSFILPLGATINMDGTAIYEGVVAIFVAHIYGIDLTLTHYFLLFLAGTFASIGCAGVPGAALIMMSMVMNVVGLPIEGVGLVASIDIILEMIATALNVTGDTVVCALVAKSEGEQIFRVKEKEVGEF